MTEPLQRLAEWGSTIRLYAVLGCSVGALTTYLLARLFERRVGDDFRTNRFAFAALDSMSTQATLMRLARPAPAGAGRLPISHAVWACRFDCYAWVLVASAMLLCVAALDGKSDGKELAVVAGWVVYVGGVAALCGGFASLSVVKRYRRSGKVWWLGASISLVLAVVRWSTQLAAGVYIILRTASL